MAVERAFRPVRLRLFGFIASGVLVLFVTSGWILLPEQIRQRFTGFQLITLLAIVALMILAMLLLGASRVWVTPECLTIRNGFITQRVGWAEVAGFRFRPGDPWAYALINDVDDPRRVPMLAIQAADKHDAQQSVEWLRTELSTHL